MSTTHKNHTAQRELFPQKVTGNRGGNVESDVYVNIDGARIVVEVPTLKTFKLRGVSDPATISFDEPVSYSVHPFNSRVAVTDIEGETVMYKSLVGKEGKYVTVTNDNNELVTKAYKVVLESGNKKDYEITIHSNLKNKEIRVSYINSDITWYPSVTIKLSNEVAQISYVAVLNNNKEGYEGNYFVSILERTTHAKENIYKSNTQINALSEMKSPNYSDNEKEEDDQEEIDRSVTLHLGQLSFKDTLVVPIEQASVDYTNTVFVDIGFYDSKDSSSQVCQEGFSFVSPFYFPAAKAFIYKGTFFTNTNLKTHHKKQLLFNRLYKSKQVGYTTTHTENFVADKTKYKDVDFNKFNVIVHTWKVFFTNSGPEIECLITLSGLGDIIHSVPKTLKGLEQRGSLRTTCIIMGKQSSNITLSVVKIEKKLSNLSRMY